MSKIKELAGQSRFDWAKSKWELDEAKQDQLPDSVQSSFGEVYDIGRHRLMCGDSGNMEMLRILIDRSYVDMVYTDPPYGVSNQSRSDAALSTGGSGFFTVAQKEAQKKGKKKDVSVRDRELESDSLTEEEFMKILTKWFLNLSRWLRPGGAFYIWGGYQNFVQYPTVLAKVGLYFSQSIIWVKGHPLLNRKDFLGNHECCFYGWKEGGSHNFYSKDNYSDVWEVKKISPNKMLHLTEKPVELAIRAIECSTKQGDIVLDMFAGSGSTLVACEATNRRCYAVEVDPWYCDVIRNRMAKHGIKSMVAHSCL